MVEDTRLLVVVSGPSGVGKDAVLDGLKGLWQSSCFAVTATTRPPREGEVDGVDYHFVSRERFQEMVQGGELLEWAEVYGNLYGVPLREVKQALDRGLDVVVKVDVQGAATIKGVAPEAVLVFLVPPSEQELTTRLTGRNSESAPDLKRRMDTAQQEMERLPLFDYVVVNDEVELAVAKIDAIVTAEKCRVRPRQVEL
ncbi:MAG: guanylate kinase [Chloroflexota bacterium]|nr:guanylate kinase [Chloroflexota bacterium]